MEPTEEHILNLSLIQESEGECLHISQFVNEAGNPHPNPDLLVEELTAFDWVETEENPAVFYLTPEGYEFLEYWNNLPEHFLEAAYNEPFSKPYEPAFPHEPKQWKKAVFLSLFILGFSFTILAWLNQRSGTSKNEKLFEALPPGSLEKIKEAAKQYRKDSLLKSVSKEELGPVK